MADDDMKRTGIALLIMTLSLCTLAVGINDVRANPNAIITHVRFLQGDGTIIDLINGGMANAYVNQLASVNLTAYNPDVGDQGAYLFFTLDYITTIRSPNYWVPRGGLYLMVFTWVGGISPVGTYSYQAKLWWDDGGTPVLQDSVDITIAVTQKPPGYNLSIKVIDQTGNPIGGAMVSVSGYGTEASLGDGSAIFHGVSAGIHDVTVKWKSQYNPEEVTISTNETTIEGTSALTLQASVYDAELKLVTPTGEPIVGADVSLGGVYLGSTDVDGKVVALQVPSKHTESSAAYPIEALWFGVNVSPGPVTITASGTYTLTATDVATLTVQAVGAQGQGLRAAEVDILNSEETVVFSGVTDEHGIVNAAVPYDTYTVAVYYKGFSNTATTTVNSASGTTQTVATDVFIEFEPFGPMAFTTFLLWMIIIIIVIAAIVIVIRRIRQHRRQVTQELPPPPPPPP